MEIIADKQWWIAAGVRAVRTMCQTAIATIGTAAVMEQVPWQVVISSSLLAGLLSLLTSLKGLPELDLSANAVQKEVKEEAVVEEASENEGTDDAEEGEEK